MTEIIRIGSRKSDLAVKQAEIVKQKIEENFKDIKCKIITISTKGDQILDKTLDKIGGKGLFVKEIEKALLNNEIDLAVHSLKDMPSLMPEGLILGAVTKRENPRDVLVSRDNVSFYNLPKGAKIGTGSLRRKFQLLKLREDIEVVSIRGNIMTRMEKINEELDAVVLAEAGLNRCDMKERISYYFEPHTIIPAACQGILAIQIRDKDTEIMNIVRKINDEGTELCANAERQYLDTIGADCHAPVGAYAKIEGNKMIMIGFYFENNTVECCIEGCIDKPRELGAELAKKVLEKVVQVCKVEESI